MATVKKDIELDYYDNNGMIDYFGNVNKLLYDFFGIDANNQEYIKSILVNKS